MAQLSEIGTYRGEIVDAALKISKKGYPMFVATLRADEVYVDDKATLDGYVAEGIIEEAEPQWFDCSDVGGTVTTNMPLFKANVNAGDQCRRKDPNNPNDEDHNEFFHVERLVNVFGWGGSFSELSDNSYVGKKCMFRVKENSDPEYTNLDVAYIGGFDDDPTRSLNGLDVTEAAALDKLIVGGPTIKKSKKAARPKPATTKGKGYATSKVSASTTKKTTPPAPTPKVEEDVEEVEAPSGPYYDQDAPDMDCAWDFVCTKADGTPDDEVSDAWGAAIQEVMETTEKDSGDFTQDDWTKVAKTTLTDLAIV